MFFICDSEAHVLVLCFRAHPDKTELLKISVDRELTGQLLILIRDAPEELQHCGREPYRFTQSRLLSQYCVRLQGGFPTGTSH